MKAIREFAEVSAWAPSKGDQLRLYRLALAGFSRGEAKERLRVSDNYFNGLYKQLKDYMALGVLNNPLKDMTPYQRQQCEVRRNYETAMMLILLDKREAGVPLSLSALRKAEQLCMYQVALDITRRLRAIYGYIDMDKKKFQLYTDKQQWYRRELLWELEAEDLFYQYSHEHLQGRALPGVEARLAELATLPATGHRFHYMRLLCQVVYQQVTRQEEAMLATCREAIALFSRFKYLPYVVHFSFYYRAIAVHLARGEYPQAERVLNQSLAAPKRGGKNWQILMLHRALLGFYSGKPAMALEAYRQSLKVPKQLRTEEVQERWRIIRAYLELFSLDIPGTWRLSKFLNSLPPQPDKTGSAISVLVVELLHLLKQRNLEQYRYRCERLTAFIDRHLSKQPGMERPVHFLRLLQCVVRGGFVRSDVSEKAVAYLAHLQNTAPRIGVDVREVEVVPFERLWEMVLGFLK